MSAQPLPGPALQPLEITVNIQPNAECITPLELGDVTYQYPTQFTTDKISEIVISGAPVGFTRFSAIYGAEPSVTISRGADVFTSTAKIGSANFQSQLPLSSIVGDADDELYSQGGILNPPVLLGGAGGVPNYSNTRFLVGVDTPRWSRRDSSVYFPQVDFFPRYNQWFASTIWSTPYDPQELLAPEFYPIMFVYVNRTTKEVFYRQGRVKFARKASFTAAFDQKISVLSAQHFVNELTGARNPVNPALPGGFNHDLYQYSIYLTGSTSAGLVDAPGVATHTLQLREFDFSFVGPPLVTRTLATFAPGDSPFNRQIVVPSLEGFTYSYRPPGTPFWGPDYIVYPKKTISGLWLRADWTNSEGEQKSTETQFSSNGQVTWIGSPPPSDQWPLA